MRPLSSSNRNWQNSTVSTAPRRLQFLIGVLVIATLAASCSKREISKANEELVAARKPNTTPSTFLKQQPGEENTSTLLLFVHGIFGDTIETWKNSNGKSLSSLILEKQEFSKGYDAFAFGFPSQKLRSGNFSISEAAATLDSDWRYYHLEKYQRVIVIAHSMGGLVVLEALTTFSKLRKNISAVVTYATPYNGSQISKIVDEVLDEPALRDMIPADSRGGLLPSLTNRWKNQQQSDDTFQIKVFCAYETVAIPGIGLIVPPPSAMALCDGVSQPVAEDHIGIVKPDSQSHDSVKFLVNALREIETSPPPVPKGVDSESENSRASFELGKWNFGPNEQGWDLKVLNPSRNLVGIVGGAFLVTMPGGKFPTAFPLYKVEPESIQPKSYVSVHTSLYKLGDGSGGSGNYLSMGSDRQQIWGGGDSCKVCLTFKTFQDKYESCQPFVCKMIPLPPPPPRIVGP